MRTWLPLVFACLLCPARDLAAQFATQDRILAALAEGAEPAGGPDERAWMLRPVTDPDRPRWSLPAALASATILGFERTGLGPALTATAEDLGLRLLVARAARDTVLVRALLAQAAGALARVTDPNAPPPLLLAETEAWLGDTAAALRRLDAFAARRAAMDTAVSWGGVRNGWLLARTGRLRDALRFGGGAAARPDTAAVTMAARHHGAVRYRYDVQVWTRAAMLALPFDTSYPTARLALVADEEVGADSVRQVVRGVALDIPALHVLSDEGLAFLRGVLDALRGATVVWTRGPDGSRGRPSPAQLTPPATAAAAAAATPLSDHAARQLLAATGPLGWAPAVPERAVRVGDRWADTLALVVPGSVLGDEPLRLGAVFRLTAVRQVAGRSVAFIAYDGRARRTPVAGDGSTADVALSGETVIDLEDGWPLRTAASLRATVTDARSAVTPVRALVTALRQPARGGDMVMR